MLLISNKGNIEGENLDLENTPDYIESTINQGYNVKIDLKYKNDKLYLGEITSDTEVEWSWLLKWSDYLWINCRDTKTLSFFLENGQKFNFFYNYLDLVTMTSKGFAWSVENPDSKGTIVYDIDNDLNPIDVLGVCSNWVSKWSKQIAICFYGDTGLPKKEILDNHKEKLIKPLESLGYYLEYYGSKALDLKENDHKYNEIYNFKGLRSHISNDDKSTEELEVQHITSIYEMIGSHPYETVFFIRWDQELIESEIQEHIKTIL